MSRCRPGTSRQAFRTRGGCCEGEDGIRQTTLTGILRQPNARLLHSTNVNVIPAQPSFASRGRGRGRWRGRGSGRWKRGKIREEQQAGECAQIFNLESIQNYEDPDEEADAVGDDGRFEQMHADWRNYAGKKRLKYEDGFFDTVEYQKEISELLYQHPDDLWEIREILTQTEPEIDPGGYKKTSQRKIEEHVGSLLELLHFTDPADPIKSLFHGVCIYVNGFTHPAAQTLCTLMQLSGGEFAWNYNPHRTTHTIATVLSQAQKKQERARQTTVKPEWILDCFDARKILPLHEYRVIKPKNDIKKMFAAIVTKKDDINLVVDPLVEDVPLQIEELLQFPISKIPPTPLAPSTKHDPTAKQPTQQSGGLRCASPELIELLDLSENQPRSPVITTQAMDQDEKEPDNGLAILPPIAASPEVTFFAHSSSPDMALKTEAHQLIASTESLSVPGPEPDPSSDFTVLKPTPIWSKNTTSKASSVSTAVSVAKPQLTVPQPPLSKPASAQLQTNTTLNQSTFPRYQVKNTGLPPSKLRLRELQRKLTRPNESHYVAVDQYIPSTITNIDEDMLDTLPEDIQREIRGYIRLKSTANPTVATVGKTAGAKKKPNLPKASTSKVGPSKSKSIRNKKVTNKPYKSSEQIKKGGAGQLRIDTMFKVQEVKEERRKVYEEKKTPEEKALDLYHGKYDQKLGPNLCGQMKSKNVMAILKEWILTEPDLFDNDVSYLLKYFATLVDNKKHELLLNLLQRCKTWLLKREAKGGLEMASWKTLFYETFHAFLSVEPDFRDKIPDDLFFYPKIAEGEKDADEEDPRGLKRLSDATTNETKRVRSLSPDKESCES